MRRSFSAFLLVFLSLLLLLPITVSAAGKNKVYLVHVDEFQTIDSSLELEIRREFARAADDPSAVAIAIEIDTPGGLVDAAFKIKETIVHSKLKTVTYVTGKALSAGALIASAGEKLYMHPSSSIGAAEPRMAGSAEAADYKTLSAVIGEFRATAQARYRDADIAQAMVDKDAPIPGQKTDLLVLTAQEAVEKKYADGIATTLDEALAQAGVTDYEVIEARTLSDRLGRVLTTPWVAILLLVVGVIALGIEFMKPGVAVPGLIGIISLGLFFVGNFLVGTAGFLEIGLGLIGIVLVIVEAFVPGFGLFGVAGALAVGASIFLAVPDTGRAVQYLMFTTLAATVAMFGLIRQISRKGLGKALTLEQTAKGQVPARADLTALIGQEGETVTVLRPAGVAIVGDQRLDVVTEGEYLSAGVRVRVIKVDGARVVVRSVTANG